MQQNRGRFPGSRISKYDDTWNLFIIQKHFYYYSYYLLLLYYFESFTNVSNENMFKGTQNVYQWAFPSHRCLSPIQENTRTYVPLFLCIIN